MDLANSTRAAENRIKWKGIVAKSSLGLCFNNNPHENRCSNVKRNRLNDEFSV